MVLQLAEGVHELRIISPEPVLAQLLASRKPILIGEKGYYWVVSWIATIGSIMRSREYIAYNLAYLASYVVMDLVFATLKVGEKIEMLKRWLGK